MAGILNICTCIFKNKILLLVILCRHSAIFKQA
jgi:hypothetical protein